MVVKRNQYTDHKERSQGQSFGSLWQENKAEYHPYDSRNSKLEHRKSFWELETDWPENLQASGGK